MDAHITVKRYWFPERVFGKGPTQSTIIRLNGSSMTGMGLSGATGDFLLGFPTN